MANITVSYDTDKISIDYGDYSGDLGFSKETYQRGFIAKITFDPTSDTVKVLGATGQVNVLRGSASVASPDIKAVDTVTNESAVVTNTTTSLVLFQELSKIVKT